jgi:uncharacterized protein (DUF2252 family)
MKPIEERIKLFHHNRQQPTLQLKYKLMADNVFSFYRATCHLFYEDLYNSPALNSGPLTWICGDLHIENFGSYRSANGLVYFDINDFEEAVIAPAGYELTRFLCSIAMAADTWKFSMKEAELLMHVALDAYSKQLSEAKAYAIERETSAPLIQEFFKTAELQRSKQLIKERVEKNQNELKIIKGKTIELDHDTYGSVKEDVTVFLKKNHEHLKLRDIAFRIAGTGSLGAKRYVVLVNDVREDKLSLLDIKEALPSSLIPYLTISQPSWKSEAERIITAQSLMQYAPPRYIASLNIGGQPYVLKQLQPSSQKIDHTLCQRKIKNVETVITTMAQALASAQLRSASRKGSADVESLVEFSQQTVWQNEIIKTAVDYREVMKNYFSEYKKFYKSGVKKNKVRKG